MPLDASGQDALTITDTVTPAPPGPFIVYALPRSRTAWLSRFLTFGPWVCGHDEIRHVRSLDDVRSWLAQPYAGTVETAAAPWWRTIQQLCPDITTVVVRRPVDEVVDSLLRTGIAFDVARLRPEIERLDHKLDQITARVPGALTVAFRDLETEATCSRVFEHCHGAPYDPAWWAALSQRNIQINLDGLFRYYAAHRPQLDRVAKIVAQQTRAQLASRPVSMDGVTFQQEPLAVAVRDSKPLVAEHLAIVGEPPEAHAAKNWPLMQKLEDIGCLQVTTARSNGRMFGYIISIISPSLEDTESLVGTQTTFFASRAIPGLGLKLQRASITALHARGVSEVAFRAGTRGDGPRTSAIFRRVGAREAGAFYVLGDRGH